MYAQLFVDDAPERISQVGTKRNTLSSRPAFCVLVPGMGHGRHPLERACALPFLCVCVHDIHIPPTHPSRQVFKHLDVGRQQRVDYVDWMSRISPLDTADIAKRCRSRGPFAGEASGLLVGLVDSWCLHCTTASAACASCEHCCAGLAAHVLNGWCAALSVVPQRRRWMRGSSACSST